jgi:hypothetical protein
MLVLITSHRGIFKKLQEMALFNHSVLARFAESLKRFYMGGAVMTVTDRHEFHSGDETNPITAWVSYSLYES